MLNKVVLMGRFTKDPELRSTPQGVSVCNFRLGVTRNYKTNGSYESDFIDCVAWRNTAEFISKFFKKGNLVCVEGSLQSRSWEQDGQRRTTLEVMVDNTYFVESKKDAEGGDFGGSTFSAPAGAPAEPKESFSSEGFNALDDDLPF
ncbi:MAG: single-stranded DNA-binding protein [Clostridia bacterium]|nr:single-stranded DNA-binding protein [Clostridia bacterium]MDO5479015.1 single-stranded DNA-binding protein [Clostridia bacterium]